MRVLGVDPGAGGALAMLDASLGDLAIRDMPVIRLRRGSRTSGQARLISEQQLAALIRDLAPDVAWVERVHAMPKQGVTSSFNFGLAYGLVRGVLAGCGVPLHLTPANEWKRTFKLGSDKAQSRLVASRLFPDHASQFSRVSDDGRAEAVLLALYGTNQPTVG